MELQGNEVTEGLYVYVNEGTTFGGTSFVLTTFNGNLGTDPLVFTQTASLTTATISSLGSGVSSYEGRNGTIDEFRSFVGVSPVTVTLDAVNKEVDVGIVQTDITSVGALDAGSITSNFGDINNGTSSITTGQLNVDNIQIDGSIVYKQLKYKYNICNRPKY